MRRKLLAALAAGLLAGAIGAAQPAQADPYFTTTPPEGCYLYTYTHQGFTYAARTYCTRMHGLHRAAARCADGTVIYGFAEEMEYMRMSTAECLNSTYPWAPKPAVEVWGEYWPDY